ncbi:hypothetical protein AIOL_002496 [Candidatus Rhodobacter oscarellae]|uniref:Hedgehog/Intein (Hint) domain-containing protein n=2 Tax=Candidatus Rhodobacter oscarellae TaxID=1675527 RepID=A0A0J9E3Z7_9RHOB|nr:hypothetical protein AIOL_002496 [Candidatus Rhodobacter lobularis]
MTARYDIVFFGPNASFDADYAVANLDMISPGTGADQYNAGNIFTECFAEGTLIETSDGSMPVEALEIGDMLRTADGGETRVLWVGHQSIFPLFAGEKDQPVRIRAGALGANLPAEDLIVTADHALMLDGYLVNASALVNHETIDFVSADEMPMLRVYHVETEAHEVILANGCPAESYLPMQDRASFANYQEYLDLYGADRLVHEMKAPRISSRRLLPESIKAKTGSLDRNRGFAKSA